MLSPSLVVQADKTFVHHWLAEPLAAGSVRLGLLEAVYSEL